jgi:hypothetical protein
MEQRVAPHWNGCTGAGIHLQGEDRVLHRSAHGFECIHHATQGRGQSIRGTLRTKRETQESECRVQIRLALVEHRDR